MHFKMLIRAAFIGAIFALATLGINAPNSVAAPDDSTSARSLFAPTIRRQVFGVSTGSIIHSREA
jgi:hypothetical protein